MKPLVIAAAFVLTIIGAACGSDADQTGSSGAHDHGSESMGEHGEMIPGEPGQAEDADREIQVTTSDDLRFTPTSIEVSAGETVTFIVHNEGETEHEFVLGDEAYQEQHEQDMEGSDSMTHMENAVTVRPGKTAELTWRFDQTGRVLYGCHELGHYEGGMVGTIEIG